MDVLRGSTTEQVLRQRTCPVLAVPARKCRLQPLVDLVGRTFLKLRWAVFTQLIYLAKATAFHVLWSRSLNKFLERDAPHNL